MSRAPVGRSPARIIHLLGTAGAEGAGPARIVAALGRGLDANRYASEAWFLGPDGPLRRDLESAGVRTRHLPWRGTLTDAAGCARFVAALTGARGAILHQHFGGRAPRLLARCFGATHNLLHLHGYVVEARGLGSAPASFALADAVVAVSQAVADRAAGGVARVIRSGVAPPLVGGARTFDAAPPVIGCASRLVAVKGIVHLLQAFAKVRAELPGARLEIAGDGPEREALVAAARSLGVADAVAFLGWRDDLGADLARWDLFAVPSLAEGLGLAAIEAMAAGLPVVASAVGGLPEVVANGETGTLVPPAGADALAAALRALAVDPDLRRRYSAAGVRRAAERFGVAAMVAAFAAEYDALLVGSR